MSLITNPTSWATYAGIILGAAEDFLTAEAENLQSTLKALSAKMHSNEILSKLSDLRLEEWPTPHKQLNEPWR